VPTRPAGEFAGSLGRLVEPFAAGLAARLAEIPALAAPERAALHGAAEASLREAVHRKVSRVLLLELNAARAAGRLTAGDSAARWTEFAELSDTREFWASLSGRYPTLPARLETIMSRRCAAALTLGHRLAADRDAVASLTHAGGGELTGVEFGAGDSHRGGQTVAMLEFAGGRAVYKPRSVEVDAVLGRFLATMLARIPAPERIRVPQVVLRDGYGWAEYVEHRYCASDAELAAFYRGIGHWLAVMRLLGGSDLHTENLIACGPVPVVVDCETLFGLPPAPRPSGLGLAVDRASRLVDETVLRTGMLPTRGAALGWRGVDSSSVGSLPGQQPTGQAPVIVDGGSDRARLGFAPVTSAAAASHPSARPVLADHWERVVAGFDEASGLLRAADRAGRLEPRLAAFADCPVRMVLRGTDVYEEVARMLWHPKSLYGQAAAVERAAGLFAQMAEQMPGAPSDPDVIAAEIGDLLEGDVPFFTTTPRVGRLTGPGGTAWLPERDLAAEALARWRAADLDLDRVFIGAALVSAYLNDDWMPSGDPMPSPPPRLDGLDRRRRALTAGLMTQLRDSAIRAEDGTVTWIAPVLGLTGWSVQPLSADLYSGLPGVALLLAAHEREVARGGADPVEGISGLLEASLRTMRAAEEHAAKLRAAGTKMRPREPGGYVGLGSQIWTWLTLRRWGAVGDEGLDRARALAELLPEALADAEDFDLLAGPSGAIVPLLHLAEASGEGAWPDLAVGIGAKLVAAARPRERGGVNWPSSRWPDGLGGCAHGATGVGWALARLALVTGDASFAATAEAAFAFEETLYDAAAGGWADLREQEPGLIASAWCHGAVGVGVTAADLARRGWRTPSDLVARAAASAHRFGIGWNHTLCHGDLGSWELLVAALEAGCAPEGVDRRSLDARIIGSLEHNGAVSGLARDAFSPALMSGLGGVAYQLLRMGEGTDLPSVLVLGGPG
jgi:type 2 lantibiotic biosynthesis protein LanM